MKSFFSRLAESFTRLCGLLSKEFAVILTDRSSRLVLIMPIIIQATLIGYGATYNLDHVPIAILDEAHSPGSAELVRRIVSSGVFELQNTPAGIPDMKASVDSGKALLAVHIPANFENGVQGNRTPKVQIISDARNSTTASVALSYLSEIIGRWNAERSAGQILSSAGVTVFDRVWFNGNVITRWTIMVSLIAAFTMIQVIVLSALSVARERERGTFDMMLMMPYEDWELVLGKVIPPVCIGLLESTIVLAFCLFWFRIPFSGSFGLMFLVILVFATASVAFGLLLSAFSRTMQQAMTWSVLFLAPMMLLSGFISPVSAMPKFFQILTYANPLRFATDALRRIYLENAGFSDIVPDLIPMLAVIALLTPWAGWLFRHKIS